MRTVELIDLCLLNEKTLNDGGKRFPKMRVYTNLRNACEVFSSKCYEDIRKIHSESLNRGWSAELLPHEVGQMFPFEMKKDDPFAIKVLTYCMAGRIMITIKNIREDSITLVGGEDPGKNSMAGFHGIDCEIPDVALDMLEQLTHKWYLIYNKNNNRFRKEEKLTII